MTRFGERVSRNGGNYRRRFLASRDTINHASLATWDSTICSSRRIWRSRSLWRSRAVYRALHSTFTLSTKSGFSKSLWNHSLDLIYKCPFGSFGPMRIGPAPGMDQILKFCSAKAIQMGAMWPLCQTLLATFKTRDTYASTAALYLPSTTPKISQMRGRRLRLGAGCLTNSL